MVGRFLSETLASPCTPWDGIWLRPSRIRASPQKLLRRPRAGFQTSRQPPSISLHPAP